MMAVQIQSEDEEEALRAANEIRLQLTQSCGQTAGLQIIGPSDGAYRRLRGQFRFVLYLKAEKYDTLIFCKDLVETMEDQHRKNGSRLFRQVDVQFDFDPINPF